MHLEMRAINKSFGHHHVLKDVDLELRGGEVVALLGENGAGKSTLMNILGGVLPADSGEILLDGQRVHFTKPYDSLHAGISFIHQELSLIVDLPIYENMFLGDWKRKKGRLLDHEAMIRETEAIFKMLNLDLDPRRLVRDLDASYKQIVEIARGIHQDAAIMIMDEPTAALTDPEIERVFAMVRTLRDRGVGIIFISHKLNEVMHLCDRYLVLRNGVVADQGRIEDTSVRAISNAMVGHELTAVSRRGPKTSAEAVLTLEGMTDGEDAYRDVNLTLHRGEILGVTGLLGDGRSELFLSVFGARPDYRGTLRVHGEPYRPKQPRDAIRRGIAYVPKDRKENGILPDMSVLDNEAMTVLEQRARHGILEWTTIRAHFDEMVDRLDIRLQDPMSKIVTLSGGNQQKVVLARWLETEPDILVMDNPTQGVDVGAKEDIYEIIYALAERGISIIILSSEAPEIVRLCDRAVVLFGGSVQGTLEGEAMTEQAVMHLATGASLAERRGTLNEMGEAR